MAKKSQVTNTHIPNDDVEFVPFTFQGLPGTFVGHLNQKTGDNPHTVGQGTVSFPAVLPDQGGLFNGHTNFVLNEHVTNVVARTDAGVVHFNDNSGRLTGPGVDELPPGLIDVFL